MTKFDFFRFFGNDNDSNSASKRRVKTQRRGRICRIEQLEEREMLDTGLTAALADVFAQYDTMSDTMSGGHMSAGEYQTLVLPAAREVSHAPAPLAAPPANAQARDLEVYNDLISRDCEDSDFKWNADGLITEMSISESNLTGTLDVSGCTALTFLDCSDNALTALNMFGCKNLVQLACGWNGLTTLDVSGCTALERLECYDNQLSALDVSSCSELVYLNCWGNQLSALDVSSCSELAYLECWGNPQLTTVYAHTNLRSGNVDKDSNTEIIYGDTPDPPPTPTNFRTTASSTSSVALAWNNAIGATSYEVQYWTGTKPTTPPSQIFTGTTGTITGTFTAGAVYPFQIRALNNDGASAWTPAMPLSVTIGTLVTPPTDPSGLTKPNITTSAATNTSVTLSGFETDNYYIIQYGMEGKNGKAPTTWMTLTDDIDYGDYEVDSSTVTVSGLIAGTNYQFRVSKVVYGDSDAIVRSEWSNVVKKATTGSATVLTDNKLDNQAGVNKWENGEVSTTDSITVSWSQWGPAEALTMFIVTYTIPSGIKGIQGTVVQDIVDISGEKAKVNGKEVNTCRAGSGVETFIVMVGNSGKFITYNIEGLVSGATYKVSIVGVNVNGAVTKTATITQRTLKEPTKAPAKLKAEGKPSIDSVKLTWNATSGADKYIIQVWSPKTKTDTPKLVRYIEISAAEYASVTSGGISNGWTISGLMAGTKYTLAVKAEKTGTSGFVTVFASKVISTAKYPAPKINLAKGVGTIPAFANGLSGANYQHYEVYYVDINKKDVCIGTVSLPTAPNEKDKIDLNLSMLTPNANFAAFETWVKGLGKKSVKFVVKAVTNGTSGNAVNWSAGGYSSLRADSEVGSYRESY